MVKLKGAQPSPKKANPVGHHPARAELIVLPQSSIKVPSLPSGYHGSVKRAWRDYWRSPVASAANRDADLPGLLRWAWAMNELTKISGQMATEPTIETRVGIALNPVHPYLKTLLAIIERAEIEYGMTPLSRSRLGLTIGQAKKTAQELSERLTKRTERGVVAEPWEQEWDT